MIRSSLLPIFLSGALLLSLSGCAEAPIKMGDNNVEKPLHAVTGLTTDDVEKASQKTSLSLWDVYALAAKHTEILATSAENVEQAKAQNAQAIGAWLPQIALNGSKAAVSNQYLGGASNLSPIASDTVYLSGGETIISGLNQLAAVQGAQATIDFQNENLRNAAATLLSTVAQDFYNVLQLQDALQTQAASRDLTEKTLEQQKSWQAIGRAQKSDVLSTSAQLAQVVANLTSTQDQLTQAKEILATLANIKPDTILQSDNEVYTAPAYSLDDALTKIGSRPDVRAATVNVDIADAQLLQAHGEHLPSLSVQGQYYVAKDGGFPQPEWNLQLEVSVPIFEGGQIIAQEDSAASKKRQAQLQLSLARRNAVEQVRQVYQDLTNSITEMDAYQKAVDAAQSAYEAVLHDYKLSLTTNIQVLNALSVLETTKESWVKAKYQVLADQVSLGVAIGDLPKTRE